jgi:hypothetical protein
MNDSSLLQKGVEIGDGKDEQGKPPHIDVLWGSSQLFQASVNH